MSGSARSLLCVAALVAASVALILYDLSGANRPHELRLTPLVAALAATSAAIGLRLVRRTWRARSAAAARAWGTLVLALVGSAASVLLLVGAVRVLLQW